MAFARPRDALAVLPQLSVGVIVTDYEMPELNGFEFMAEAFKLVPTVPFILITGHPLNEDFTRLVSASPAKTVLPKPFSWWKLADEIVRYWLETATPLLKAQTASV